MTEIQKTLHSGEQIRIRKAIAQRVCNFESDSKKRPMLFQEIQRDLKRHFRVTSYKEIQSKDLLTALNYIDGWAPRTIRGNDTCGQ